MFSITVALANTQIVWTFMYKTKESADEAWALYSHGGQKMISDDFGQSTNIPDGAVAGALFEDLDQSKMAHIERALHTERVKIAAQRAAQADPAIKTAMMTQRGPAMFDPTMQNGRG